MQMENYQKPEKLSHIKRSIKMVSIIFYHDNYTSANEILTEYGKQIDSVDTMDESILKRADKTIQAFLKLNIIESKTSKGYRLKKEFKENKNWILTIFS